MSCGRGCSEDIRGRDCGRCKRVAEQDGKMSDRTHWIVFATFLPLFLVTAVAKAQPTRTPTPLPPLVDTPGSTATGISSGGVVVGGSLGFPFNTVGIRPPGGPPARAIVWDRRGIPAPLPLLAGDVANTATGISANGKSIIGLSFHPGDPGGCRPRGGCDPGDPRGGEMGVTTAVIWGPEGIPAPLPPLPGGTQSIASAINPAGVVVGASLAIEWGPPLAVVWDGDGTPAPLPPLPGDTQSEATAINPAGVVVGFSAGGGGETAVMWDPNAVHADVPTPLAPLPDDTSSRATGISPSGVVVGWSYGTDGITAVVWDGDGIPTPLPPLPGDERSEATAINPAGLVVGNSCATSCLGWNPSGGLTSRAVVWDRDGIPAPLLPRGSGSWTESEAAGINAPGAIVGSEGFTAVVWR
jgi:uncharacterized membrane protein